MYSLSFFRTAAKSLGCIGELAQEETAVEQGAANPASPSLMMLISVPDAKPSREPF